MFVMLNSTRFVFTALLTLALTSSAVFADDATSGSALLDAAAQRVAGAEYNLHYNFSAGEQIKHKVVHLVTIATTIKGTRQTAKTRSISTKLWSINKIDADGTMHIVHSVPEVDMWNQISGSQEVRYNSKTDKTAPSGYETVAKSVGVPLTSFTMNSRGEILSRSDKHANMSKGGQLVTLLPPGPIKVGGKWYANQLIVLHHADGRQKRAKTRQQFRLEKVTDGIASISIHTQVLTPVNDPKLRVQLVQRLSHGSLTFDIKRGRITSQTLGLDETVLNFNGPDSSMQYAGKFTETPLAAKTAKIIGPAPR
jgi:hypothetical protein